MNSPALAKIVKMYLVFYYPGALLEKIKRNTNLPQKMSVSPLMIISCTYLKNLTMMKTPLRKAHPRSSSSSKSVK